MKALFMVSILLMLPAPAFGVPAGPQTGEGPNLGNERITQEQIESGMPLERLLELGKRIFSTPFNKHDGHGDGPLDPAEDPRLPGGRPCLQNNGTFLRVNGLDAQTCVECHFIAKNSTIPATLGIGGVAGAANNAIILPSYIDIADLNPGTMNGRFSSPPFLFGAGGVELLAKEMTADLQNLKARALQKPGTPVTLLTKGVGFGTLLSLDGISLDTSAVHGIDEDLVVRPFGRKGDFPTVRQFDVEALQFHFGMQPVEVVGENFDADGDGVENEIRVGELSALHIFATNFPRPVEQRAQHKRAMQGSAVFSETGCDGCHIRALETRSQWLTYSFPEVLADPGANVFYSVNLRQKANFESNGAGGLVVELFSDLKRHDMGSELADSTDFLPEAHNSQFVTARLWGIRDTAPYLHDGRATTITDAILKHGGEAQEVRDRFNGLSQAEQEDLIAFLYTLRTPDIGRYAK
jgi:hypothetical protein